MITFNDSILFSSGSYTYSGEGGVSYSHSIALDILDRKSGLTIIQRSGTMDVLDRKGLLGE